MPGEENFDRPQTDAEKLQAIGATLFDWRNTPPNPVGELFGSALQYTDQELAAVQSCFELLRSGDTATRRITDGTTVYEAHTKENEDVKEQDYYSLAITLLRGHGVCRYRDAG